MSAPAINGVKAKEVFELLRDDLEAVEREFGRDTVSAVPAITDIGEYLRAGGGSAFARRCCCFPPSYSTTTDAAPSAWVRSWK